MKISPIALIVMSVLSLAILGRIGFVVADLYFLDKPIFYKLQTCSDGSLRFNVLWLNVISNLIILVSAYLIYRLFIKVIIRAVWKQADSLRLTALFIVNAIGFFLDKMGESIADDFLMGSSKAGCPVFSNAITSSYYLKAAILDLLFDPLYMMVFLLMALFSAFLRYSYGLKVENESII